MTKHKKETERKSVHEAARELMRLLPDQRAELEEALAGILPPEDVDMVISAEWICPNCQEEHQIGNPTDGDYDDPQSCPDCGWMVVLIS